MTGSRSEADPANSIRQFALQSPVEGDHGAHRDERHSLDAFTRPTRPLQMDTLRAVVTICV